MARKKTHEHFKKALQEAWEESVLETGSQDKSRIPEPDLSFLDSGGLPPVEEQPEDSELNLEFLKASKRRKRRRARFAKPAAALALILLTASVINVFWNSQESRVSYGDKTVAQNVKPFSTEEDPFINKDGVLTLIVSDESGIAEGEKVVGTIYKPEYIPDGYRFFSVLFENTQNKFWNISYTYENDDEFIQIDISRFTEKRDFPLEGSTFLSSISGRKMYWEQSGDLCTITCPEDHLTYRAAGELPKEEILKVVDGIVKKDSK